MSDKLIGVAVSGKNADEVLGRIERCERAGIPAVWMTTGGAQLDSITVMAAAAGRTQQIKFGTSVVPTFPRHPLVMVQQTQVVAQLAPGRFRPRRWPQPSSHNAGDGYPDAQSSGSFEGVFTDTKGAAANGEGRLRRRILPSPRDNPPRL